MAAFNPKSDNELDRLSDEQVVEYIVDARDHGRLDCANRATGILAYGHWKTVYYRVALKVPREEVEDVTAKVVESSVHSVFSGKSIGEFRSWLKTITRCRIADFHRGREGNPDVGPLPGENEGDDGIWGDGAISEDETGLAEIRELAGRLLEKRPPLHQLVIRHYGPNELNFMGLQADEVARAVEASNPGATMSAANVHQIWSRFKADLERELGQGGP